MSRAWAVGRREEGLELQRHHRDQHPAPSRHRVSSTGSQAFKDFSLFICYIQHGNGFLYKNNRSCLCGVSLLKAILLYLEVTGIWLELTAHQKLSDGISYVPGSCCWEKWLLAKWTIWGFFPRFVFVLSLQCLMDSLAMWDISSTLPLNCVLSLQDIHHCFQFHRKKKIPLKTFEVKETVA